MLFEFTGIMPQCSISTSTADRQEGSRGNDNRSDLCQSSPEICRRQGLVARAISIIH
jgi:hypothetical protein